MDQRQPPTVCASYLPATWALRPPRSPAVPLVRRPQDARTWAKERGRNGPQPGQGRLAPLRLATVFVSRPRHMPDANEASPVCPQSWHEDRTIQHSALTGKPLDCGACGQASISSRTASWLPKATRHNRPAVFCINRAFLEASQYEAQA